MSDAKRNALLLALSLAAGCVDAIAFLHTGAFPANMTGNSVVLALALLHVKIDGITLCLLALLGYCLGAAAASLLLPVPKNDHAWSPRVSLVLLLGGLLLLGCAASLGMFGPAFLPLLITLTAAAMGMQSAAVLRLGVTGVATTVITGTLTTAMMGFVNKARGQTDAKGSPGLTSLIWLAYFAGAFVGGMRSVFHFDLILVVPGLLLVGTAAIGFRK